MKKILFALLAINLVVATPSVALDASPTAIQGQSTALQQEKLKKQRDALIKTAQFQLEFGDRDKAAKLLWLAMTELKSKEAEALLKQYYSQEERDKLHKDMLVQVEIAKKKAADKKKAAAETLVAEEKKKAEWDKKAKNLGSFQDCALCPEMAILPPGEFMAGPRDYEENVPEYFLPRAQVKIAYSFAIGKYEVTREQYGYCIDAGVCNPPEKKKSYVSAKNKQSYPVNMINWHDAQSYVKWLSEQTGRTYRLPSEREWEYAARAGTTTRYYWGDELGENNAWCKKCKVSTRGRVTSPTWTGRFKPNPFGLYDMVGNVSEMQADCYAPSLKKSPNYGKPYIADDCQKRVIRGGDFDDTERHLSPSGRRPIRPMKVVIKHEKGGETIYLGKTEGRGFRIVAEMPR